MRASIVGAVAAAAVAAAAATVTAGAMAANDHGTRRDVPVAAAQDARTVTVERGSITEVTTLPATIVAQPEYELRSTAVGALHLARGVRSGAAVKGGAVLGRVDSHPLVAPGPAVIKRVLVPDGTDVNRDLPVLVLMHLGFAEAARVPPEAAFRVLNQVLRARADITAGPGPFDCPIVAEPATGNPVADEGAPGSAILCLIPGSVRAYDGLAGTVAIKSGQATDVLTLPVTAVAGRAQNGEVLLIQGSRRVLRRVTLGITNGATIEITSGLTEGDQVLADGPTFFEQLP